MLTQQKHTYSKNLTTLTKQGLYDPTFEHDACGVGLVANIDGTKSHHIICLLYTSPIPRDKRQSRMTSSA